MVNGVNVNCFNAFRKYNLYICQYVVVNSQKSTPNPMKDLFAFIISKRFLVHFSIWVLLVILIFWGSFKALSSFTHHGEMIQVPDFYAVRMNALDSFISDKRVRFEIIDSVYDAEIVPGTVVKQEPEKGSSVKENRIIYLTVSSTLPPFVKMPNIVDASMRQALSLLESSGLKPGRRDYRPDPCMNCVLSQSLNGEKVEPGTMVPKGSVIDLVIGQGQDGELMLIPCLVGLNHREASNRLAESGMSEGAIICDDCKTVSDKDIARVYKQIPSCSKDGMANPGTAIDLHLTLKPVSVQADSTSSDDEDFDEQ